MRAFLPLVVLLMATRASLAYPDYSDKLPGYPDGCSGVGHDSCYGGGPLNTFGDDFKAAGYEWTEELCRLDSDGDGQSNGVELGDPCCTFKLPDGQYGEGGLSHSAAGKGHSHPGNEASVAPQEVQDEADACGTGDQL